MARRYAIPLLLAGVLASMGAGYRSQSTNFLVEAPTPQIAQQVAQYAEHYRKEKATQWLGREMPPWREPCPIQVKVTMQGAGGATTFEYGDGQVMNQHMVIEGSLDRLLASVLPHEVTHTVFAHYYRCPVPRWADEGGSVLSEDDIERNRHDQLARQILNTPGRAIPLRRLFALREYPGDVMCLYAQGYSVTNFLVDHAGRSTFLAFLAHGLRYGWDNATQTVYHYRNIEDLERAWIDSLRQTRRPPVQLAANTTPGQTYGDTTTRVVVRQTAPMQASLAAPQPIVRGQAGEAEGDAWRPAPAQGYPMPSVPPDYPVRQASAPAQFPPAPPPGPYAGPQAQPYPPAQSLPQGPVMLGAPQFAPAPGMTALPAQLGTPVPAGASPVGYPQ